MAAGDYVIRRNASNTDTYPTTGSDLLLIWDTAVANVGSGIAHSAGTFTLGETGHFLVMASDYAATTSQSNNERINNKMTFTLAGTELVEGYSTSYIRKNNTGSDECLSFSAAIINVTTTTGNGDDLEVRVERVDNSTTGSPARAGNNRNGITIIKLDDTWNYGRYESSAVYTTSVTDNVRTVANLGTTVEQDSPFTRSGNVIDIATNNLVLAVYSVKSEDAGAAGRSEYHSNLELNSTAVPGAWTHQYVRTSDTCDWGGSSCVMLLEPTSGWDIDVGTISREGGGEDFEATLQLVELPSGTEACIAEATTGDYNTAATNFAWDTNPYIDTAAFTHSTGNSNIDVDNDGDYIVMAGMADATDAGNSATRAVPALQFRVNTTDQEIIGDSSYNRNQTTADHSALQCATLLDGLSANDSIHCRNDRLGTATTTIANSSGAFGVIRLSSLFEANKDIAAVIPTSLSQAADLDAQGTVASTIATTLAQVAALTAAGELTAAENLVISMAADLDAAGELVTAVSMILTAAADLDAAGELGLSAPLSLVIAADLDAQGTLASAMSINMSIIANITQPTTAFPYHVFKENERDMRAMLTL